MTIKRRVRRQDQLIAQAVEQRIALTQQIQDCQRPLEFADRIWTIIHFIKSRPLLVAVPFGFFAIRRSGLFLRWLSRSWLAKEVIRKLFIHRCR
jgi:tRNA (Thr-GGU) A37 N-methylase